MSLNNYFQKVYLINLDRRKDRLAFVEKEFKRINTTFTRFAAYDGDKHISDKPLNINKGELGAYMSHMQILEDIVENRIQNAVIFEDDVMFCDNFLNKFESYFNQLPDDKSLVYISANHERAELTKVTDNISLTSGSLALHSYFLDLETAEYLLKLLKIAYPNIPVDDAFTAYHNITKVYTFYPNLTWQRADYSDTRSGFRNYDDVLKN